MYSVDLAARHVFAGTDFDLFVTQTGQNRLAQVLGDYVPRRLLERPFTTYGAMRFRLLDDIARLRRHSHVVYWGDFQNNPVYGYDTYALREFRMGHSPSIEAGFAKWRRLFALTEVKPVARAISVGNNFQNDFDAIARTHPEVFAAMGARFDAILPRDPYSVENLSRHLPAEARPKVAQGMDCAFLLPAPPPMDPGDHFCCHFGRSGFRDTAGLIARAETLTRLRAVDLDRWFHLPRKGAHEVFTAMRAQIRAARFVLTDTYHVAVNAMTLGTPVYGIGRAAAVQDGTLGDFKKRVLFAMMDAAPFYTEAAPDEPEAEAFDRCLRAVADQLHRDPELGRRVSGCVADRADGFRSRIDAALDLGRARKPAA